MGSISLASNITTLSSHNVEEKDAIIELLQWEFGMLKEQVEEFNNLQMLVIKVTGKNGVRKLKEKYLTTSDKVNANEISYFLCNSIWPHVKLMPEKWHKWNKVSVNASCLLLVCQVDSQKRTIGWELFGHLQKINCVQCNPI